MEESGAPADRDGLQLPSQKKRVSFAIEADELEFDKDEPITALRQSDRQAQLEYAGPRPESGEDIEMVNAVAADDAVGPVASAPAMTSSAEAPQPRPDLLPIPAWAPHQCLSQSAQLMGQGIAQWHVPPPPHAQQFHASAWMTQPLFLPQVPHPPHLFTAPGSVPLLFSPSPPPPFPPPHAAPLYSARSDDPEINEVLDRRNGQVRDLLDWLITEARTNAPPRNLDQILHAVDHLLRNQHPIDANIVRRMILRHREPKWQSHTDLFDLLQSYLLGNLSPSLFKNLVSLLEEFCRHEQHLDRDGQEYSGEIVNPPRPT